MGKKNGNSVPKEETVLNPALAVTENAAKEPAPTEIKDETAATPPAKEEKPVTPLIQERPTQFDTRIHEAFTPEGDPKVSHRLLVDAVWYDKAKPVDIVQFVYDPTGTASGCGHKAFRVVKANAIGYAFRTFRTSPPRLMVLCNVDSATRPDALNGKLYANHQGIMAFELKGTCRRNLEDGSILAEDKNAAAKFLGTYKEPAPKTEQAATGTEGK